MKPVIIIAIAFVLLIPIPVFAEYEINDICEWALSDDVGIVSMGIFFKDEMVKIRTDAFNELYRENYEDWEREAGIISHGDALYFSSQSQRIMREAQVDKAIEYFNVNPELRPTLITMIQPETSDERLIQGWIVGHMLHPDFYGKNLECEQKYLDEKWESFSNLMYTVHGSKADVYWAEIEKRVYGDIPEKQDPVELESAPVEQPKLEQMMCTLQWDPMCGVDGETYGNLCMLDAAGAIFDYGGECVGTEPELKRKSICGDGTIDVDGICQVAPTEEKQVEKSVDTTIEKPSKKSVNWFSSLFDWLGSLFR